MLLLLLINMIMMIYDENGGDDGTAVVRPTLGVACNWWDLDPRKAESVLI